MTGRQPEEGAGAGAGAGAGSGGATASGGAGDELAPAGRGRDRCGNLHEGKSRRPTRPSDHLLRRHVRHQRLIGLSPHFLSRRLRRSVPILGSRRVGPRPFGLSLSAPTSRPDLRGCSLADRAHCRSGCEPPLHRVHEKPATHELLIPKLRTHDPNFGPM
eukprot:scaffold5960_cov63-Phaeocystis_antarctica.AAC.1